MDFNYKINLDIKYGPLELVDFPQMVQIVRKSDLIRTQVAA